MDIKEMKIVAFGDSLTQGNAIGGEFKNWTDIIEEELETVVVNAGVGGNTTDMARKRFEEDVISKKPDVVLINFGMNDHLLDEEKRCYVELQRFSENICFFLDRIIEIGAKPILVTPNYFIEGDEKLYYYSRHKKADYEQFGGALKLFDLYTEKILSIAKERNIQLIDVRNECNKYNPYEFLRTMENCNANDGVHPGRLGVRVYADLIEACLKKMQEGNL